MTSAAELLAVWTAGLTRSFGDIHAIDELDIHVPIGSVYGFLGPNGAGKTTTIRLLLGLAKPDRGNVWLLGQLHTQQTRRELLSRVGALVETPSLYPHLTGYENLRVTQEFAGWPRSSIDRSLGIVGLQRDAHRLVRVYSLGMRQRLGLALALLGQPELLILDEPTNGLDPAGIHEMRTLLCGLPAEYGVTVFVSSHLLAEVEQLASHVGIIARGRMLFEGSMAELRLRQHGIVVIEVDRPEIAASVLGEAGCQVKSVEGDTLTADLPDRTDMARAAAALVGAGLSLYQLRTERPSLEDLFLSLTDGLSLDAAAPAGSAT